MIKPDPTSFLIADISGYTEYLSGVEIDHAQDILADLMNTVVMYVILAAAGLVTVGSAVAIRRRGI